MSACLGLGCYFYHRGLWFGGEALSEEKVSMRTQHDVMEKALRGAGIEPAACPFNTKVTLGDVSDVTVLSNHADFTEPLVSAALALPEGETNAA